MTDNKQYLLDTNILIDFLKEVPSVVEHILRVGTHQCCMSVISLHELYFGAYLAREKKEEYFMRELERINTLLEYYTVLPLDNKGDEYARIKYALRKIGKPVDEFDILIAGHALSEGLTVHDRGTGSCHKVTQKAQKAQKEYDPCNPLNPWSR